MKAKLFYVLLFMFLGIYSVNGQVDIFKSQEETARRLDSMDGKSTPQRRENSDTNRNSERPESNNRSPGADNEATNEWERMLEEQLAPLSPIREGIDEFDSPETKCLFIMVVFIDLYLDVKKATLEAEGCREKSDLYGLEAAALAATTTIMYCPESLFYKSNSEKREIWDDIQIILQNENNNGLISKWKTKLERICGTGTSIWNSDESKIDLLSFFFHPTNLVTKLLNVQQNIEALGCPD